VSAKPARGLGNESVDAARFEDETVARTQHGRSDREERVMRLRSLGRGGRLLLALAAGGAAFGIATAVQASIPDASGVVHACYNTSRAHGTPTGALRAIDTDRIDGNCASWEGSVDLATPQFVTSTVNQTSFMIRGVFPALGAGSYFANFGCPAGYIASDTVAAPSDNINALNFTVRAAAWNVGEVATGVPNGLGRYEFTLSATTDVTVHSTCIDARVFGLPGPAAPISQAMHEASVALKPVS
jgi:hypothetical protein